MEELIERGEGQYPQELADATDHGISTMYRVLERMHGIVTNDNASVTFAGRKFAQEVSETVETMETHIESTADRSAKASTTERETARHI